VTLSPPYTRFGPTQRTRDATEAAIISILAGDIAESWVGPSTGYQDVTEDERHAMDLAESISPASLARLEALATLPEMALDDETKAMAMATALVGDLEARLYAAWLRAVAERQLRDAWPAAVAVARELDRAGYLSGDEVRHVVEAAGYRLPNKEIYGNQA
jgi:hypothetical protein